MFGCHVGVQCDVFGAPVFQNWENWEKKYTKIRGNLLSIQSFPLGPTETQNFTDILAKFRNFSSLLTIIAYDEMYKAKCSFM